MATLLHLLTYVLGKIDEGSYCVQITPAMLRLAPGGVEHLLTIAKWARVTYGLDGCYYVQPRNDRPSWLAIDEK